MLAEKYRPKKIDEIVGHDEIKKNLKQFVKSGNMPNLLLIGPPGIGKTAIAHALARELGCYPHAFLEINASDESGVKTIRGIVKDFCMRKAFGKLPFKILLLDEGDAITSTAQQALRRIMEQYSGTTRFIITGNDGSKIVKAIKSRCTQKYMKPLSDKQLQEIMLRVQIGEEKILPAEVNKTIIELANGDARAVCNLTESAINYDGVTPEILYKMHGMADVQNVYKMLHSALKGHIKALDYMDKLVKDGASPTELMNTIYWIGMKGKKFSDDQRLELLEVMRLIPGTDEMMVLASTIATIVKNSRSS